MKLLILAVAVSAAIVSINGMSLSAAPQYAMVPDATGWKLVNVNEDPEPENFFTPETDIIFTLFTNENPTEGTIFQWNDVASIRSAGFNADIPTRLTIHGWNGDPTSRVNTAVRQALFQFGRFNVIQVDWSAGAGTINYISARNRVGPTGVVVATLLETLAEQGFVNTDEITVIGHSLGAHVAGFVGKTLGGDRLGNIVALDAALPLFSIDNPDARVNTGDARYVQSIHTNAGTLGFDQPIGDGNFYPNGGSSQPGCGIDLSGNCAHGRSHEFYAESINSQTGFWATRCNSYTEVANNSCTPTTNDAFMGQEPLDGNASGVFRLNTGNASPFALGRIQ